MINSERRAQEQRATTLRLVISLIKNYDLGDDVLRILGRDQRRHHASPVQQQISKIVTKPQLG